MFACSSCRIPLERLSRLETVLAGVQAVLRDRDGDEAPLDGDIQTGAHVAGSIQGSVLACTDTLNKLQTRIGGLEGDGKRSVKDKWKIAVREPSITRINGIRKKRQAQAREQQAATEAQKTGKPSGSRRKRRRKGPKNPVNTSIEQPPRRSGRTTRPTEKRRVSTMVSIAHDVPKLNTIPSVP